MAEPITAKKSQRRPNEKPWWWISGDTYPHRGVLKQQGARFSKRHRAWYYIGAELPAAIRQLLTEPIASTASEIGSDDPCSVETAAALLGMSVKPIVRASENPSGLKDADQPDEPTSQEPQAIEALSPSDTKAPAVRVLKPTPFPAEGEPLDVIQSAIRATKTLEFPPTQSIATRSNRLMPIQQRYCGELTGSISGQVYCYGYAIHEGVCIYLNMGGPRTSVEAIRAKLGKGDIVTLVSDDSPALELTAGEGNTGMYMDYLQTIPEARFTSLILLHDWVIHPNYNGAAMTFLLQTSEAQAKAKLKHHIAQLVNIPVFDAWSEFLWAAGQAASLLRPTRSDGGIDLLTLSLDGTAWTRLITSGVEQQMIQLPILF